MATVANIGQLSEQYSLPQGYAEWKKDVSEYVEKKRTFQGEAPRYEKITTKFIKGQDCLYNPITQAYTSPQTEAAVQRAEQQNMIDVLAKNRDNALRYEQTYNILNFENKLKGLEDRDNYPKAKPWYFRPGKDTNCDYNIISNIDMQQHHFQPPEKRPPPNPPVSPSRHELILYTVGKGKQVLET